LECFEIIIGKKNDNNYDKDISKIGSFFPDWRDSYKAD